MSIKPQPNTLFLYTSFHTLGGQTAGGISLGQGVHPVNHFESGGNASLEGARSDENRDRQLPYFETLNEIGKALNASQDLERVLQVIVRRLPDIMDLKGCTIRLLDPIKGHLELMAASGLSREYLDRGSIDGELSTHHALKGEPVVIFDAQTDIRNLYRQAAEAEGIASILAVPLVVKRRIIGVLRLLTSKPYRFTEADIRFAMAVAEQGGIAINNAINYQKIRDLVLELEQQEDFLQQVIDNLDADLFVLDREGRFVTVNHVFLENHRMAASEVMGRPCHRILRIKGIDGGWIHQALAQNRILRVTRSVETTDGTVHFEVTVSPVSVYNSGSKADFFIGTIRDVTDHVRLLEEHRKRERLQGVVEMAGAVAHELNTPLFSALGTARLLAEDLKGSDRSAADLKTIIENLETVTKLTRKMTRITRYASKSYVDDVTIFDIEKASG